MSLQAFVSRRVTTPEGIRGAAILVEGERIRAVVSPDRIPADGYRIHDFGDAAILLFGPPVFLLGLITYLLMALSFQPMLRFYNASPFWGLALPAIGAAYTLFTVQSAVQMWRGKGGLWKGRAQAMT